MRTEEVELVGGGRHLTVFSRFAGFHHKHLSASLISIHFNPEEVCKHLVDFFVQMALYCIQSNSNNNCVSTSSALKQRHNVLLLLKSNQIPPDLGMFKNPITPNPACQSHKRSFCDGCLVLLNCPMKHNNMRLMASFTK